MANESSFYGDIIFYHKGLEDTPENREKFKKIIEEFCEVYPGYYGNTDLGSSDIEIDEDLSKEFFNLTNSDKKSDIVLFDKNYVYSYFGQESVGLFAIIYTFKDQKQSKEINLFVRKYGNVIVISSNTYDDNTVGLLYQYKEYFSKEHYKSSFLL